MARAKRTGTSSVPALSEAVRRRRIADVRKLLRAGADANERAPFGAPLHSAAYGGVLELVKVLAAHGAKIDAVDRHGATPLHAAAQRGHVPVVKFLLTRGANVNGARGMAPLTTATYRGQVAVVRVLLAAGADPTRRSSFDGSTPLGDAALNGNVTLARLLLKHDESTSSRREALLLAAKEGHGRIVRLLLDAGVDPNRLAFQRTTVLGWARRNRHRDVVAMLVAAGAR